MAKLINGLHEKRKAALSAIADETGLELFPDRLDQIVLGIKGKGPTPLKVRLSLPPNAPISIAEMIIDDRITRLQLNRALKVLDSLVKVTQPVIDPT